MEVGGGGGGVSVSIGTGEVDLACLGGLLGVGEGLLEAVVLACGTDIGGGAVVIGIGLGELVGAVNGIFSGGVGSGR